MREQDNRDSPQWHGGTLGDRFADAGHAERAEPARLRDGSGGGGGRHPGGRSCFIHLGAAAALLASLAVVGAMASACTLSTVARIEDSRPQAAVTVAVPTPGARP